MNNTHNRSNAHARRKVRLAGWQLYRFPNKLRNRLKMRAIVENTTMPALVARYVGDFMKSPNADLHTDDHDGDKPMQLTAFPHSLKERFVRFSKDELKRPVWKTLADVVTQRLEEVEK